MKGLQIYNENKTQYMRININEHDEVLTDFIEDILDLLEINKRKNDKSISWTKAKKELFELNLIIN